MNLSEPSAMQPEVAGMRFAVVPGLSLRQVARSNNHVLQAVTEADAPHVGLAEVCAGVAAVVPLLHTVLSTRRDMRGTAGSPTFSGAGLITMERWRGAG